MLTIVVLGPEYFDEKTNKIYTEDDLILELEHSLVSLSKWEEKYEKPFLGKGEKSAEEVYDYVSMMILTKDYPQDVISRMSQKNIDEIQIYIEAKRSATWFNEPKTAQRTNETITSELIYSWMVAAQIPFETQYWHLNKLFNLIKIINLKSSSPKKMSRSEAAARQRELNAQRRAQLGTSG